MDLQMPEMNGIEAMTAIRAEFPEARIIVLTTYTGDVQVLRAIKAGASGYLLKSTLVNEMLSAIRAVHAGRKALSAEVSFDLADHAAQEALSPLEVRVLRLIAEWPHEQGDRRQALRHRGVGQEPGEKHPIEAGHGRPHACSRDWAQAWDHRAVACGVFLRGGASMRFHPKSRASTDQRPGPNIARRGSNGSCQQADQWMFVNSQDLRDLDHGNDCSGHGRP